MARIWMSGFGLQTTGAGVEITTVSSGTIQTSVTRLGTAAARVNPTGSSAFFRHVGFASDQSTVGYQRVYLRIATLPSANTTIMRWLNAANGTCAQIRLTTTGTLVLLDAGGTVVGSASSALSTGTWYRVELGLDASTSPGTVTGRLDGTQFATGANSAQSPWSRWTIGAIVSTTTDLYFTDWAVNDNSGSAQNSWPGDGAVLTLSPNAAGDANAWSNTSNTAGSSTNYQLCDELPPDDATTLVQTGTLNNADAYEIVNSGMASGDVVNVVMVGVRARNNVADAVTAFKVECKKTSGGTTLQSAAIIPNSTSWSTNAPADPRTYPLIMYVDPDGSAWTQSTVDSMQVGVKLTTAGTNRIQASTLWALVDYSPSGSTPITGSETGSGAEAETVAAALAGTETGSGTEAATLNAALAGSDTGAAAEAERIDLAAQDAGAATEAESLVASSTATDAGSAADAGSLAAALSGTETGSWAEAETIGLSSADTGSGVDAETLVVSVSDSDTGSWVDAQTLQAGGQASDADTGSGSDAESLAAVLASAETGSGSEAEALTVQVSSSDTATLDDAHSLSVVLASAETGSGADAEALAVALTSAESASFTEAQSLSADGVISDGDTGSGTEAETVSVAQSSAETATATDAASLVVAVSDSDTAVLTDAASLAASLVGTDQASGFDAASVAQDGTDVASSDDASAVELAALSALLAAFDTAQAVETASVTRASSTTETASFTETASVTIIGEATLSNLGGSLVSVNVLGGSLAGQGHGGSLA